MSESPSSPTPFDPSAGDTHQRRRKGWRYVAGILVLGLVIAGLWPSPLPVETAKVTRGPLVVTVNEEGVTQVRHRYVISSPVSGNLRRITLKPGAEVVAGENTQQCTPEFFGHAHDEYPPVERPEELYRHGGRVGTSRRG